MESTATHSSQRFVSTVAFAATLILLVNVAFPWTPAGTALRGVTLWFSTEQQEQYFSEGSHRTLSHHDPDDDSVKKTRNMATTSIHRPKDGRPVMHTFFHRIDPDKKGTAMSDAADQALLDAWAKAWFDAGWEPVVLTLEDAMRHSGYERYSKKLEGVPMMGKGGMGLNILYNQLCYYRWLAMAASGGGWMSDYDVFPLTPSLPRDMRGEDDGGYAEGDPHRMTNGGDFTVYAVGGGGKGIPCLMSGRAGEWTRMALNILENGLNHRDERMWTDMFALMDISGVYKYSDDVLDGKNVLTGRPWVTEDCQITANKRAVHFSHAALDVGKLKDGEKMEDRAQIVQDFWNVWKETCSDKGDGVPVIPEKLNMEVLAKEERNLQEGVLKTTDKANDESVAKENIKD